VSLVVDDRLLERHNLTRGEYDRIVTLLGREPNLTELGLFSVMWSEHCSYKSSKLHLRTLPTRGPRVLQGPGENAGAVDIGDGLAVVFKIESHNHPSFIEPYQGAATGVGGILRDIFTMGARPLATLNSLRFGPLDEPKNRRLLSGVVAVILYGIAIRSLGVAGGSAFIALVPASAALLAIPMLGEYPTATDVIGMAITAMGVLFTNVSPAIERPKLAADAAQFAVRSRQ